MWGKNRLFTQRRNTWTENERLQNADKAFHLFFAANEGADKIVQRGWTDFAYPICTKIISGLELNISKLGSCSDQAWAYE